MIVLDHFAVKLFSVKASKVDTQLEFVINISQDWKVLFSCFKDHFECHSVLF